MFEGPIGYIIGGAVIGLLARLIKPGADPMGWIMTLVLGIGGALLAGMLVPASGFMLKMAVAIVAAIALIFGYEILMGKRKIGK